MTAPKTRRDQRDRRELVIGQLVRQRTVDTTPVDDSRARITVCPPKPDTRFAPAPGHVGEFARAGIGRYVEPDTGPDTEGQGF